MIVIFENRNTDSLVILPTSYIFPEVAASSFSITSASSCSWSGCALACIQNNPLSS